MKRIFVIIFALLVLSIPAIKSLLPPGGYTSHDLTHHVVRQIDMDKLLSEGQFPPRWSGDLNQGYGYPLFNFAYPAPSILGEVFHKIGFNFVESVKVVMLLSMLISVIGMYLFLNSLFPKQRLAAFLGSMFYLYAPVRFLNVYVSAAVGNALAMGIVPFIFWAIVKVCQGKKWAIPVGSVLIALLITSHNVTTLMFAPVMLVFSLILIYKSNNKFLLFKKLALMTVLGFGLAAFFWIPALTEKKFIVYDSGLKNFWANEFPTLGQLIHSPWGYGLAHPGVNEPGALSFQVGLAHLGVIGLLLITVIFLRKRKEYLAWGIFCLAVFAVSIFLQLKVSAFVWAHVPLLYLTQFPSRFSAVAIFAASLGSALLIIVLPFKKILFILLLAFVLYANRNHLNVNEKFDPGEAYYVALKTTTTSFNEYMPIWAYFPQSASPGKLIILNGKGQINISENKSAKVVAEINLGSDSTLRFNQFYFPGWVLRADGKAVQFSYQNEGESKGLPVFRLPKGTHLFEADFTETPDRKAADIISLISLGATGVIFCGLMFAKRRKLRQR